jgi:hypothetical protein
MTMVRPCRLITRQRSHMGFTDGLTFISTFFSGRARAPGRRHNKKAQLGCAVAAW